ncbi:MAG: tail fiber domain-containing protein [Chitinophagaceae bacterium]
MKRKIRLIHKRILVISLLVNITIVAEAQHFKIGQNLGVSKPSVLLELESDTQALLLPRIGAGGPATAIKIPYPGMLLYDSTINKVVFYDGTKWISSGADNTIYTGDGTLSSNRVVTMNARSLMFVGRGSMFKFVKSGATNAPLLLEFYKSGESGDVTGGRSGYMGFGSTNNSNFSIVNAVGQLLILAKNGINIMLDTTGKVSIGNNLAPTELLDLRYNGTDNYMRVNAGGNSNSAGIRFSKHNSNLGWRIRFDGATQVLALESTTPDNTRSKIAISVDYTTAAVTVPAKVVTPRVEGVSDNRLKKDVSPIHGALSKILQLQGVSYEWRKDMEKQSGYSFKDGRDYGLIAQEVQKVLPELVKKETKGFLTVDYTHIIPIIIEAIKQQQKEIETLKDKVNQIDQLTKHVNELKAMVLEMKKSIK